MNHFIRGVMRTRAMVVSLMAAVLCAAALAGDLNPPPGAVAPTMKPISDLDPRRVLNELPGTIEATHVISQPGQYVLTRDVQGVPGKHGILVATGGRVSIHLNGFSLNGVAGSFDGIHASSVFDLSVFGFSPQEVAAPASRVGGWGGNGIQTTGVASVTIAGVSFENNAAAGIAHIHSEKIIHRDLAARNSGGNGITIIGNASAGSPIEVTIQRCVVDTCGGDGLLLDVPASGAVIVGHSTSVTKASRNGIFMPTKPTPADGTVRPHSSFSFSDILCSGNGMAGIAVRMPNDSLLCGKTEHLRCISNGGNGLEFLPYDESSPHSGQTISITSSEFTSNGASGVRSNNPLYVGQSNAGQNVLFGLNVSHSDPYTLVLQLDSSNVSRNAAGGVTCARGRYANVDCQITDNGGDGISIGQGCLIMTDTSVTRSVRRGVAAGMATITATRSSLRRNGEQGLFMDGGTLVAEGLLCEFNGLSGAEILGASSVTLTNCSFNENGQDGVKVRSSTGPVKWMAPECNAARNAGSGFDLDNIQGGSMDNCKAVGNGLIGFQIGNDVRLMHIAGCTAMDNPGGIVVYGTQNVIVGCTASNGPIGAFAINVGNAAGPVISAADVATSCNPRANVAH